MEQPPVVLHIAQALRGGGAESFVRELIPRLRQRNIDARVLCAYGDSLLTHAELELWQDKFYLQERIGVPRITYLQRMIGLIQRVKPDIVHTHTHVGASWGRIAAVLAGVRLIAHTEHTSLENLSLLNRIVALGLNRQTSVTVVFSERSARLVRRREGVHNLKIIPNGVAVRPDPTETARLMARKRLGVDENLLLIGLIANLHPHKNPALAIEALGFLSKEARNTVRLAIFGEGPLHESLLKQAENLDVHGIVRLYGFRTDIEDLIPGLDLVVSTSHREMMPISLLESMNAAVPIIGVPHSGVLDLVIHKETGFVLDSWSARDLANAIEWARTNREWRTNAGLAGRTRLKQYFDIEAVADQYSGLYERLLDEDSDVVGWDQDNFNAV